MLMQSATEKVPTVRKLWLDGGHRGRCVREFRQRWSLDAEVVLRSDDRSHGRWQQETLPFPKAEPILRVVKRRWVVERMFAWLGRYRRLSKEHEAAISAQQAWLWVAGCRLLVQRLAFGAGI